MYLSNLLKPSILILMLSGCQNVQTNSKVIATAFDTSTHFQRIFLDHFAPENVSVTANVTYQNDPQLSLDIYQSQDIQQLGKRPTIVWIHGGGWVSGAKDKARGYFKLLAAQGYNVVSVQYTFAPEAMYPTQLYEINNALEFLTQHSKQYNIDANQLFLAGDSAGANLASHYAALLSNPTFAQQSEFTAKIQANQLKGLILHCGIYDMNAFVNTAPDEMKLIEWGVNTLVQAYTGNQKDNADYLKRISPAQHLTLQYPPVFISSGNKYFLTDTQSMPFVKALQEKKIPVEAVFYPNSKEWLVHEYQFFLINKASRQTFDKTIQFIEQYRQTQEDIS